MIIEMSGVFRNWIMDVYYYKPNPNVVRKSEIKETLLPVFCELNNKS